MWPKDDVFAVTVDGKVLMNAQCFEDADLAELAKRKTGVFVGVIVRARESRLLSEHVYDVCADVASRIIAKRRKRRKRRR